MNKTILTDNEYGTILRYDKVPNRMFNFYALRKRDYKDGTTLWHLCMEIAEAPAGKESPQCVKSSKNFIKLESFRGSKSQALKRIDDIVREYK